MLAFVELADSLFKFENRIWDAKVIRGRNEEFCVSLFRWPSLEFRMEIDKT